jgi:hypothetical protein
VKAPIGKGPVASHRPPSPTGWSWLCPCGWTTPRNPSLEHVERTREGHIRLHTAAIELKNPTHVA